jgi:beta-lactam-binding protein with PASTA domain
VDDEFPRDTVVKIYISQGKDQVEVPLILGLSVEDAKAMLFDQGFYSDTIILRKAYDVNALPGQVFKVTYGDGDTAITSGTKVSVNELIIVYYREPESQTPEDGMMGGTIDSNPALGQ